MSSCSSHKESTGSELSGGKNLNYKLRITLDSERKDNYLMKRNNSLKTFNFRKQNIQKCWQTLQIFRNIYTCMLVFYAFKIKYSPVIWNRALNIDYCIRVLTVDNWSMFVIVRNISLSSIDSL